MIRRRQVIHSVAAAAAGIGGLGTFAAPGRAIAQTSEWPSRSARLIVPSNPGSGSDALCRGFAQYFLERTRQPMVIDNKPGANTIIGAEAAKNAAPDGYTFFYAGQSSHAANPVMYSKLPYDAVKDFANIGLFGLFPFVVVVRKDSPFQTIGDLVDAAKARPGKLSSGFSASSSQVPLELLKVMASVDILTVSYKAAPQVVNDVAAGTIDFAILAAMSGGPGSESGLLRTIGVTSARRYPPMPAVPAVAEKTPGFVYEGWAGLSAPARTPLPILESMNRLLRECVASPAMAKTMETLGVVPAPPRTLAQTEEFIAADRLHFAQIVRLAKIPRIN